MTLCVAISTLAAAAACSSSSSTVTGPSPSKCDLSLTLASTTVGASGGTNQATITTTPECTWSATTSVPWLSDISPASGQGSGQFSFRAAANPNAAARDGELIVNNARASVRQEGAACRFEIAPSTVDAPVGGSEYSVTLTSVAGCSWTAASDASWISVTPATGNGGMTLRVLIAANDGSARTGTVRVSDQVLAVRQEGAQPSACSVAISPLTQNAPAGGASGGVVTVAAPPTCSWSAVSNAPWIVVNGGGAGAGNGVVTYSVAANNGSARTGTITIGNQTFTVSQEGTGGCSYSVSPTTQSVAAAGGIPPAVQVSTAAGCAWTATSNATWVTIVNINAASGGGNGTVTYNVEPNTGPERTATLTIAGRAVTVTQAAAAVPCTYSIDTGQFSVPATGASRSVNLTTGSGCAWTATTDAAWVTITSPREGTGPAAISFAAAANTGGERSATLNVAGRTVTITQAAATPACSYTVDPAQFSVAASGGNHSIALATATGCAWSASSDAAWVTITSPRDGSGPATIAFTAAANTGAARSASITAGGQRVSISQAAAAPSCTSSITPTNQAVAAIGGAVAVSVTTPSACAWTATSNAPWITVLTGQSGSGSGTVSLAVLPNIGPERTGTVTIAGQTLTVVQAALPLCTFELSRTNYTANEEGGEAPPVTVTAADHCTWTAQSNVSWIRILSGASGTGTGVVRFTLDRNTGNDRREGTLTIAGQIFRVTQRD